MTELNQLPALLFDFDGVLADTEPLHFACWQGLLAEKGITLEWDYYETQCIGMSDRDMLSALGKIGPIAYSIDELLPLYPLKKQAFSDLCARTELLSSELKQLLTELSCYKMAVVTSSGKSEIEPILLREGVLTMMQAAIYGNEVKALKPDPEPYRTAMERLGVTHAIAFEDSRSGIASATAAGCEVVIVRHASELPELLRSVTRLHSPR